MLGDFTIACRRIERENPSSEFPTAAMKAARSAIAKAGAHARHTENHAMKAEAFAWLDSSSSAFKSMDAMAQKLSTSVVPVAFRTARKWVGEWKKLRSASRT